MRLRLADATLDMRWVGEGWWELAQQHPLTPGLDYGYLIDESDEPLPDPRSRRQPHGVHGLSRTVDPGGFTWTAADWHGRDLAGGVIYELHIGTFTPGGTLDCAIEKLDYLADLGVDFVEPLPVNAFNGVHNWGYDGVLWYAVHEPYGGPAAYARFVDACHHRGLGVIQDVVYNHLGPSGNYLPRFGPYLSDQGANTWGDSINLDGPGSDVVRRYIIDNALMWLRDYRVDGLRLDAVHALVDTGPKHILQQLAEEVDAAATVAGRPMLIIAESDLNDARLVTPIDRGGYGLTAQWSDDYHHAAHVNLTGETSGYYGDFDSLAALGTVMQEGFFHRGTYSSFRERVHGVPIDVQHIPTWKLVTFIQDHDQIGNRATGDRLSASLDTDQLAIAAVLGLLGPFTPMIFMGEEWGASTPWQFFTSHPEPELGKATARGRIAEFEKMGWDAGVVPDPQDPRTFARSHLDWGEQGQAQHARLLELHRTLLRLRREIPSLTDPRFSTVSCVWDEHARWLRWDRDGASVAVNFAAGPRVVPTFEERRIALSTSPDNELARDGIHMVGHSAAVLTSEAEYSEKADLSRGGTVRSERV